ncbi:MAG: hypothetical protein ACJAR8_000572 [Bacteroidia bacterium]
MPRLKYLFGIPFFLFAVFSIGPVYAQSPLDVKISEITCDDALRKCLATISDKSGVHFNYKNTLVDKAKFSINTRNTTLGQVLTMLRAQCEVDYSFVDSTTVNLFKVKGYYVYGTLLESGSGERIAEASILLNNKVVNAITDKNGLFRIYTTDSLLNILVYHPKYQLYSDELVVLENTHLVIHVKPIEHLPEVSVVKIDSAIALRGFDEVKPQETDMPTIVGEADALSRVKLLPGIQNVTFGEQGLVVRGGSPDQNFILLDGIPVYNTFHMLGLFSIFNASTINSIKVHKDAFPSKYSSRLSSVIDVNLNNGNKQKTEFIADIGVLSSSLSVNGPIIKNKLSYSVSARRTYADIFTQPLHRIIHNNPNKDDRTALWSYDLFAKIHYRINDAHQVSISAYNGGDQLNFITKSVFDDLDQTTEETKGSIGWRNVLAGIQYNYAISSRLFLAVEASSSSYNLTFSDLYAVTKVNSFNSNKSSYKNGLQEQRVAVDLDFVLNRQNILKAGIGLVNYVFNPFERQYVTENLVNKFDSLLVSRQLTSQEYYMYAENKSYFEGGNVEYGFKLSQFTTENKNYVRIQPKLLLMQNLSSKQQLRLSLSVANQFVHLVPNNNLGLPIDVWLPVTSTLQPLNATQLSTKYIVKYKNWEVEAGMFSKFYRNILEHQNGAQLLTDDQWEANLSTGSGRAYGLELATKANYKKYNIYLSYTYSRSKRTVELINDAVEYYSKYDRPHSLSVLAQYRFTKQDKFLVSFNYASGNPITIPTGRYVTLVNGEEVVVDEFDKINNFRLPATHHLDISYLRERKHKRYISNLVVGVYNVYNQLNPFMVYLGLDDEANPTLKLRSYLPILPMLKYSIKI